MKKLIFAGLLTLLLPKNTTAQDFDFQELSFTPKQTTFRLFAPATAKTAKVRLYKNGQGGSPIKTLRMTPSPVNDGAVWTVNVKGNLEGCFYTFDIGQGETPGVFARAVGVNGKRAAIINPATTNPEGWNDDRHPILKSPTDLVVYELHHRDFSIARQDAQHRGKFLALTEPWAIKHLQELGVNAIHILPSYDFGSIDETRLEEPQYNWGYDPVNYNVPEGSYSTDPYRPEVRIREFKEMVQALHRAGIRVILDVVYNHTFDIDHSNFQLTYPDYYYRVGSDGSGCGNETASEKAMMRRFMIESVKYWINEYHIDGFRFDLMGVHDIQTMNEIRRAVDAIDPTIIIYGEGWSAGQCALPTDRLGVKANISRMPGIAAFSDEIRDALRGPFNDDAKPGWLGGITDMAESIKFGIAGCINHPQIDMKKVNYSKEPWANQPIQMISYVSCHDDMCLVDRLKASIPACSTEDNNTLIRLDLLAQTAVFTSQGIPFMLSGEELLRTKQGVHNSFKSPDNINQINWTNKERYPQVFQYYKDLIKLRRNHPAFRLGSTDLVRRHLEFLNAPKGVVAYRLKNYAGRDDWNNIIVVLNANSTTTTVDIPNGQYVAVCCEGVINEEGLGEICGSQVSVAPQSALIIHD